MCAIIFAVIVEKITPSYLDSIRSSFDSPHAHEELEIFYSTVEAKLDELEMTDGFKSPSPKPISYRIAVIPDQWIGDNFGVGWGTSRGVWGAAYAHINSKNDLVAIEFYGSRSGCFVSRDPTLQPIRFYSIVRLRRSPLSVTAIINGEHGEG
ncbi:MAG: hypothetical protein ACSHX0_12730 [Akkermansiaceae bacterium]